MTEYKDKNSGLERMAQKTGPSYLLEDHLIFNCNNLLVYFAFVLWTGVLFPWLLRLWLTPRLTVGQLNTT
jgi:hypothetical protein